MKVNYFYTLAWNTLCDCLRIFCVRAISLVSTSSFIFYGRFVQIVAKIYTQMKENGTDMWKQEKPSEKKT